MPRSGATTVSSAGLAARTRARTRPKSTLLSCGWGAKPFPFRVNLSPASTARGLTFTTRGSLPIMSSMGFASCSFVRRSTGAPRTGWIASAGTRKRRLVASAPRICAGRPSTVSSRPALSRPDPFTVTSSFGSATSGSKAEMRRVFRTLKSAGLERRRPTWTVTVASPGRASGTITLRLVSPAVVTLARASPKRTTLFAVSFANRSPAMMTDWPGSADVGWMLAIVGVGPKKKWTRRKTRSTSARRPPPAAAAIFGSTPPSPGMVRPFFTGARPRTGTRAAAGRGAGRGARGRQLGLHRLGRRRLGLRGCGGDDHRAGGHVQAYLRPIRLLLRIGEAQQVAVLEGRLLHGLAVQVGAREAHVVVHEQAGVVPRDLQVCRADVGGAEAHVGETARAHDGGAVLLQGEHLAVGRASDHDERRPIRKRRRVRHWVAPILAGCVPRSRPRTT